MKVAVKLMAQFSRKVQRDNNNNVKNENLPFAVRHDRDTIFVKRPSADQEGVRPILPV